MTFKFDDKNDFDTNLASFLDHMEGQDADMGKILRAQIKHLSGATDDAERRVARALFNLKVKLALDNYSKTPPAKVDEK